MSRRRWPFRIARGFGYLTLNPSPRLRRLRERQGEVTGDGSGPPCPLLPESAYPPGAVPLDVSGIPGGRVP